MESQQSAVHNVTVDGNEARSLVASGHRYLDVRLKDDFDTGHVEGALNVPYYSSVTPQGQLLYRITLGTKNTKLMMLLWIAGKVKNPQFTEQVSSLFASDETFIVGCRTGVRAKHATVDLLNAGFENVKYIAGGYLAWLKCTNEEE
ncbi:rhodanese-like domain-containing protein 19, mitochondrial isoform X2 [Canna indica]|uniref:Rhodanese-like domain-containing protein 19, mitochondrial isoform X2 n=1 Tax=Canna indica TaxID=4628 RepID=A0AAQ3KFG7_9LILI|nr:rhodanese-like domain-containing protein 19, mitochondrial isoform X2 [Canna indica]